jgi:hypothetical protein
LFYARVDDYEASAVLPLPVHDLFDVKRVAAPPRLLPRQRNVRNLLTLLQVAQRWALATTPGDPFARLAYLRVREAIIGQICGLVGGRLWASIEERRGRQEHLGTDRLESALAKPGEHLAFRRKVRAIAESPLDGDMVERFGAALGEPVAPPRSERLIVSTCRPSPVLPGTRFTRGGRWLAEYLLRLASDSGSVLSWSTRDNEAMLEELLVTPIALRAARMLVLLAGDEWEWAWD